MDMELSTQSVLVAAGSAAAAGAAGLGVLWRISRRSPSWAVRLAPVTAVAAVAAGVAGASLTMLLNSDQVLIMTLVLAVSILIAVPVGIVAGRHVAELQRQSAEHEAARERDRQIEERRRELISWLSHDLRTPLARMRALTEAQEDGLAPPDYTTRIMREIDGLTVIVADITTLSRLRSPTTHLDLQPVDLSDLVSDAVGSSQPLADRLGITLSGSSQGRVLSRADPGELGRAVGNLISNALRHTRPEGFVAVQVRRDGDTAVIEVRDQCGGIPEQHIGRVFDAGWRGTSARTPGDAGAGLGLTITRSVAEAHGGGVGVRNTDDGCLFALHLPLQAGPQRPEPVAPPRVTGRAATLPAAPAAPKDR
jgi:signal transduction histidine kinase